MLADISAPLGDGMFTCQSQKGGLAVLGIDCVFELTLARRWSLNTYKEPQYNAESRCLFFCCV
jgi:hypothetical protein